MSFYRRHVVPRLVHLAMRQKPLLPFRRRVIGAAQGRVLEIGIGSGLNLPLYGPAVRSVIGLEPSPELLRMARRRCGISVPVEFLDASAEAIPLDDKSVDAVVTTWTLCTIPDVRCALAEMRRVLRDGRTGRTRCGPASPAAVISTARWTSSFRVAGFGSSGWNMRGCPGHGLTLSSTKAARGRHDHG